MKGPASSSARDWYTPTLDGSGPWWLFGLVGLIAGAYVVWMWGLITLVLVVPLDGFLVVKSIVRLRRYLRHDAAP